MGSGASGMERLKVVTPVHPIKKVTILVSLVLACVIVGVGVSVTLYGNPAGSGTQSLLIQDEDLVMIDDEETMYGPTAEVIGPVSGQAKATTAVVGYDGAITVRYYSESANSFKVSFTCNGITKSVSNFPANNSTVRFPLLMGEGTYTVTIYEMIGGGNARAVSTHNVSTSGVQVAQSGVAETAGASSSGWTVDTTDPYLTAVADINWSDNLTSVKKARELCTQSMTDEEKAKAIYNHLVANLTYNFDLVGNLPAGYTPSMDSTYSSKTGICYDFASLYAGMMRSVGVKCKVVKGYNSMVDGYHAWNEVSVNGSWQRIDLTIDTQLRSYKASYGFSSPQGTVTVTSSY